MNYEGKRKCLKPGIVCFFGFNSIGTLHKMVVALNQNTHGTEVHLQTCRMAQYVHVNMSWCEIQEKKTNSSTNIFYSYNNI